MELTASPLTLWRMTTRNLLRRPMRTGLTALGVAVGVVAIVALGTIARGLWVAVDSAIHFDQADLLVFQADIAADILSLLDEERTRARLASIPEIRRCVPTLWYVLPVEQQPFCLTYGMRLEDMDPEWKYLVAGRNPARDDEVGLGTIARRMFGKGVGDELLIRGQSYRIVGVFRTDVVFFDSAVVLSLARLQRLAGQEGRVTCFQVYLRPGADADAVAGKIERAYPELAAVADVSQYNKVDQGLQISHGMVWAVSFIALVIGSLVIANTMWMAVLERTREIGVLRAVGWSRRRIVGMIILEASGVGLLACLLGCGLGVGLAELTTVLPVSQQFAQPAFHPAPFALALAVALALSVVGAALPAWRAARISPAEALRYE